jgi:hypothetical protein
MNRVGGGVERREQLRVRGGYSRACAARLGLSAWVDAQDNERRELETLALQRIGRPSPTSCLLE